MSDGASSEDVLRLVEGAVRAVLGVGPDAPLDTDLPFVDLGFDSLAAVELGRQLYEATGIELPLTVGFDYPTPAALAGYLAQLLAGEAGGGEAEAADTDGAEADDTDGADADGTDDADADGTDDADGTEGAATDGGAADAPGAAAPGAGEPARRARPVAGDEAGGGADDPVAIVGVACRLPGGARDADSLWELLEAGRDATSEFPSDRGWDLDALFSPDPDEPGTTYVRRGGFLDDALDFDPALFGIGDREAVAMDPQQRLLLEAAWQAFEDAGIDPRELRGEPVGVYVGLATHDYYGRLAESLPPELEGWFGIGNAGSVASGRIAYTLGLQGPALTVDTACSSSLVGLHLAAQAVRRGECAMALAGGATVLASPQLFVEFSRHRGLSPDGRCRSFAASADGTGWSEGAGFVLLERLGEARRNGHRVLALVRGSAVNQDGASNGLSAPNGLAQEAVVRRALADGGLAPDDVDAIEAHGTATTLGDPIELSALQAVFDGGRERPLHVGSLKSNIGHCQAAAGVAGVVKTVLALERERLPATLHVDEPTPHGKWGASSLSLLTEPVAWPRGERPRRAGISAFGISGTNAHVVLEEAPPEPRPAAAADPGAPVPLVVSARDDELLRETAGRLADHLERRPELEPADVARTLAGRNRQRQRAVATGRDRDELLAGLRAVAGGGRRGAVRGRALERPRVAMLFTGQGSQRPGMGAGLAAELPAFADALADACDALDPHLERPLRQVMHAEPGSPDAELLHRTGWAQPALFAVGVALHRAAWAAGLRPQLLAGHSIGEISAAHVAGVLSLDDAAALVAARGRLMDALPAGGAMATVFAAEEEVRAALPAGGDLVVAAVNAPRAVVVSGDAQALERFAAEWPAGAHNVKRLHVSHAFHSPLMDPMLDELRRVAERLSYRAPELPIASTATGAIAGEELASPGYWVDQVRRPVRFHDAVAALREAGASVFVEAGPAPVLTQLAQTSLAGEEERVAFASLLFAGGDEGRSYVEGLAAAHVAGAAVRWEDLPAVARGRRVHLPPAPLRRRRYWAEAAPAAGAGRAARPVELAGEDAWLSHERLSLRDHAWIADHEAAGAAVVPGTAYVDLALELGAAAGAPLVEELVLEAPLALAPEAAVELQLRAEPADAAGRRRLELHARPVAGPDDGDGDGDWERVGGGWLAPHAGDAPAAAAPAVPPPGATPIDLDELYDAAEAAGLRYGPAFRLVRAAWRAGDEVVAELDGAGAAPGRVVSPALLDAAMHALALAAAETGSARVPFGWSAVSAEPGAELATVRLRAAGDDSLELEGFSPAGERVVRVGAVHGRPLAQDAAMAVDPATRRRMFELVWEPAESAGAPAPAAPALAASADAWPALDELLEAAGDGGGLVLVRLEPSGAGDRDAGALAAATHAATGGALRALQGWLERAPADARLALVTRGAVAAVDGDVADPVAAAVWGLVRSAQNEHPGRFALVDEDAPDDALAARAAAGAPQLAARGGRLLRPRLRRLRRAPGPPPAARAGTVLVTGGTRGIGGLVARRLAEQGAERLLLVSRSGERGAEPGLVEELERLGARVGVAAADAGDPDELARVLELVPEDAPLRAVFHAAGTVRDGVVAALDDEALREVLRPKVDAVAHLDALTRDLDLDEFVVLSSLAGVVGAPGQGNYAAANAFLDALAQRRRAAGLPGVSLAYGVWGDAGGMAAGLDAEQASRLGDPLDAETGLALLDAARAAACAAPVLAELDPGRLAALADAGLLPAVLEPLARRAPRAAAAGGLAERIAGLDAREREAEVLRLVLDEAQAVLGDAIDPGTAFSDAGFDSLKGVELRNRLVAASGVALAPTLVFDAATPRAVAELLLERVAPPAAGDGVERELDRLASALSAGSLDDEGRARVARRLRDLARDLEADAGEPAPAIESASAEELFSFIESGLGIKVD